MSTRFLKTATLVALAAWSAFAFAQAPSRVGRISMTQGQVTISGEEGEESGNALVNWPVTSRNQVTTGRGSRTEIRIGSTAIRLDADSALDVTELDDETLRLHLQYGSAYVRVQNPEVVRGFELSTPQAEVRLQQPGRMRIDAGRREDSTVVSVFDGAAEVEGGGTQLTVRAGKRAEIWEDDVRTGLAMRDSFDEWSMLRDQRDERSESVRYVTSEMTGYEDLDQNGVWREDREYGPLWTPRNQPYDWAPYRDGRWTFVQPWGWTWVDNAPWGYAPFHYGRWVMVNQRWCWSPGRNITRAVWSPALVGWVGGSNWNLSFNTGGSRRAAPAQGWYPLAPRDAYVPNYRVSHDHLRYLNRDGAALHPDLRGQVRNDRREDFRNRRGLTVVPQEQFLRRSPIEVRQSPRAIVSATSLLNVPQAAPALPQPLVERSVAGRREFNRDDRDGRFGRREPQAQNSVSRVITAPSLPRQVQPSVDQFPRREGRFDRDDGRPRMERPSNMPTPAPFAPELQAPPARPAVPAPAAAQQPQREERPGRFERNEERGAGFQRNEERGAGFQRNEERRQRGAEPFQQRQLQAQPQVQSHMPPQQRMAPAPAQVQQPQVQQSAPQQQAAPRPAPEAREPSESRRRAREDTHDMR